MRHLHHEIILKALFYTAVLVSELVGIRIEEVDEQIQLISWHESKKSLEVYQRLSLDTVEDAYQEAVQNIDM